MTDDGLTITELAARTGVGEATLRAWEARHGVPAPARLANGHRRYSGRDAELITAAAALRREGMSVTAALERAGAAITPRPASIFATVREQRPELVPLAMSRRALAAVSHAVEDECLARARDGLLIGGFQRERFYRPCEARWRELAAGMQMTIVLADFRGRRLRQRAPSEVPYPAGSPMAREWALIAPSGCVLARERPVPMAVAGRRSFDAIWSAEPEAVHAAAEVALGLVGQGRFGERARAILGPPPAPSSPELRRAAALTNRIIGYLA